MPLKPLKAYTVKEILFEVDNAHLLRGSNAPVSIPFMAGYVTDDVDEQGHLKKVVFERVELYVMKDDVENFHEGIDINVTLESTYGMEYHVWGVDHTIQKVEPTLIPPSSLDYNNTLKQAIGYAQGYPPEEPFSDENLDVLFKVYFSEDDPDPNKMCLSVDLQQYFPNMAVDDNFIVVVKGYFHEEGSSERITKAREVSVYYRSAPPNLNPGELAPQSKTSQSSGWTRGMGIYIQDSAMELDVGKKGYLKLITTQ